MKKLYDGKAKTLLTAMVLGTPLLSGCEQHPKNKTFNTMSIDTLTGRPHCSGVHNQIHSDAGSLLGTVSISNDQAYLYVYFSMQKGWSLSESNLYVGLLSDFPAYQYSEQKTDLFRHKIIHHNAVDDYTYSIPLKDLKGLGCIAVSTYSVATFYDINDKILVKKEGRCKGVNLVGSGTFPTYIKYCICNTPSLSDK